jgi:ubiquinone/menaquinone biosynthesis C-methylase UbiE
MKRAIETNHFNDDYYTRQFKTPYRSTVKFCDWLEELNILNVNSESNILDIGAGKGETLYYMKQRFPSCSYMGIDIKNELVIEGNSFFSTNQMQDCLLEYGDLYNLDFAMLADKFEGIVMLQTLSWLPEYENALSEIIKLNPKWIALTSLFYDGLVECKTEIKEFKCIDTKNVDWVEDSFYYNTYSLPRIKEFLSKKGYRTFKCIPFEIDVDLPRPAHTRMQTYTEALQNGKRLQISGPLLMNWYFIYAAKI